MARRTTLAKIQSLRQRHSMREIARMVGVNESTVRRALSGKTKKSKKLEQSDISAAVSRAYTSDRKAASREFRRQGIPKFGVEVPPPARRIVYREEVGPSETVESNIERTTSPDLFTILRNYRNRQNLKGEEAHVRFLGYGSSDSDYPGQWFWSDWEIVNDYTDEELDEYLESTGILFEEISRMRFDSEPPPGTLGPQVVESPKKRSKRKKRAKRK